MRAAVLVLGLLARVAAADCPHAGKQLAIARGSVVVDGVLDDATWQRACFAGDFEQQQPRFGAPPTHPVKVAVAIDGDTLYVGARMWSAGPDDIDDALTQRDDTAQAERFIVSLDPSHTRRIAYSFAVTAQGVRADWIHTDDTQGSRDMSWNPVWVAKAKILADGWSAEMAIPLSQLRLPREPAASWGIDFDWYIPHRNEDVFWRAVPLDRTAWASMFGELVDLPPIRPGINLELLPYVAAKLAFDEVPPAGALDHRAIGGFEAGLDAKLRPLPGLTISATINPDFGQVDADPAFVNLTAYEVQLPEKRPFFIENNQLFANGDPDAFYSRRIGGLPHLLPSADAIALPTQVRILGAAAATGYVEANTEVASLVAVTGKTSADAIVEGARTDLVVSPLTAWAAGRAEHQIGASVVSGTFTFVERALAGTGLENLLARTATYGMVDAKLRTGDGMLELDPFVGGSAVFGTPEAIATIAQTPTHYYQRPDQPHVHLDPTARDMLGYVAGAAGFKRAGLIRGNAVAYVESPGLELNDMGRSTSVDNVVFDVQLGRYVTTPTKRVQAWDVGAEVSQNFNLGGLRQPAALRGFGDITSTSFYTASASLFAVTPGDSDDLTRGGPRMRTGWAEQLDLRASTPNGRANQLGGGLTLRASPTLSQGVTTSATLTMRVLPQLRLDVTPSLTFDETHRQYVATVTDAGGGAETYGARYIFGHLVRKEAALELRATWSLTPDLVVTLYAQPFVSVGRYDLLGELVAAGSEDVRWYARTADVHGTRTIVDDTTFVIGEPDYSVASLRSTAVLRWELSPGSTLYVVWQQARGGVPSTLAQPLHATFSDVVTQAAIHTLAVKLSYWFD